MEIVERWYDLKVTFEDEWCKQVSFSGNVERYDDFSKLAEMLEVSPTHVKHIESGHRKPSIEILFEIAKILNISLDGVVFSKNESARTDTRKEIDRLLDVSDEASLRFILSVLEALREKEQSGVR